MEWMIALLAAPFVILGIGLPAVHFEWLNKLKKLTKPDTPYSPGEIWVPTKAEQHAIDHKQWEDDFSNARPQAEKQAHYEHIRRLEQDADEMLRRNNPEAWASVHRIERNQKWKLK